MAHAGSGFVEQPLLDHLVVGEQGAIEEDDGCALEACCRALVYGGAAGDVEEGLLLGRISNFEADGVAVLACRSRPEDLSSR